MFIIPAIDLLGGKAVRLTQGNYSNSSVFSVNPVETAGNFWKAGAKRLHIVDLDAARSQGRNREIIQEIRRVFPGIIQVGGGIRSPQDAEELLGLGIDRLVLGTVLVTSPDTVKNMVQTFGTVFLAGIDAFDGLVKVKGWEEGTSLADVDLAAQVGELGCSAIIYTNISKDGTLEGPDLERTLAVGRASGLPVILSGGVSCSQDIERAAAVDKAPEGVILGKALYTGRVNLQDLIQRYPENQKVQW